jgi:hypothetical protein
MLKNNLNTIIFGIACYLGLLAGLWYFSIIAALVYGYFSMDKTLMTFLKSFFIVFALYLVLAMVNDANFHHSPAEIIAQLLGEISTNIIFFITGFIPGILSGIAAIAGILLRSKKNQS